MHGLFTRSWALDRDNGDLGTEMGTQKLNKVPMGTWSPKLGPMWPQCIWVLWGISGYSEVLLSTLRYFLVPSNTVNDQIRNAHVKNAHAWPSSPSMWSIVSLLSNQTETQYLGSSTNIYCPDRQWQKFAMTFLCVLTNSRNYQEQEQSRQGRLL